MTEEAVLIAEGIAAAAADATDECPLFTNPPHIANRCAPPSAFIISLWALTCRSISPIISASVSASLPATDSSSDVVVVMMMLL